MRSDTNLVKVFGVLGAVCVVLSLFMNVVTIKFNVSVTDSNVFNSYWEMDEEADQEEALDDTSDEGLNVYMRYGLTMWEMRTVVANYADSLCFSKSEADELVNEIDSIDMSLYNEIFKICGIEFSDNTLGDVTEFAKYLVSTSGLFLFLPFAIAIICVGMFTGTVCSKKVIKLISLLLILGAFALMILPAKNFFGIMGIGPVVYMSGIVLSIISTVGSFVSPGVIYEKE